MVQTLPMGLAHTSGQVRLGLGIIFSIIRLYLVLCGGGDGDYLNLGVGAGVRVDQAEVRTPL